MSTSHPVQAPKRRSKGKTPPPPASRQSWFTPRRTLGIAALAIAVVAGVLIGVSLIGSDGESTKSTTTTFAGSAATTALLDGIPQQGNVLGSSKAPATLVEYADIQCPYCGVAARDALPTVIQDYVRPGKLKLEFRGLAFLGDDSEKALRAVVAAGGQNRAWHMLELLYRNQGAENSGWVTDKLLESAAGAIPGLDSAKLFEDTGSATTEAQMQRAAAQASNAMGSNIRTPTFVIERAGRAPQMLQLSSLEPAEFTAALDEQLASAS